MAAPSSVRSLPLALLLVLCTVLVPSMATSRNHHDQLMLDRFHGWMAQHGRSYPSADEKLRRFEVYWRNVEYIEAMNRDGGLSYELGENEFTDLTNEEFARMYTGGVHAEDGVVGDGTIITTLAGDVSEGGESWGDEEDSANLRIPPRIDWREEGAVTPAKNQKKCGSCWIFAAVATLESQNKISNGELLHLSEQEVMDCYRRFQSPCDGGWPSEALLWIQANGGITTEDKYPYVAEQGECKANKSADSLGKITGVGQVRPSRGRREEMLAMAVVKQPVAVAIDATDDLMQYYKSGIYTGPCTTSLNHAVVVVGYGVSDAGVSYWIVKNSWGQTWGEKGFFRMRRGADGPNGLCGIVLSPGVYPEMQRQQRHPA